MMQQRVPVHQGHCWVPWVRTVRHRNSLLAVLQPTILGVEVDQKSLLVLHIHRSLGLHHAVVSALSRRDCFPGGMWAVAVSSWKGQWAGRWQGMGSCDWKAPLVAP